MERLRQLVVAIVGREEVGCPSGSDGGTVDDKVGEAMQVIAHFFLGGGREEATVRKETGGKATGEKETVRKATC